MFKNRSNESVLLNISESGYERLHYDSSKARNVKIVVKNIYTHIKVVKRV